jgi:hypothetical protein
VLEYKPAPPEGLSRLGLDDKLGHRLRAPFTMKGPGP